MKGLCASLAGGMLAWASASAGIMGDLPDATHAWAVHDPNRPRPPVVTVGANGVPSDATVLFDGSERTYRETWVSSKEGHGAAPWTLADGIITSHDGSIETKRAFGDCQLHVEWCAPDDENPQHGNSGVYLMGLYEVQIINSHEIAPGKYHKIIRSADEQAACVYGQKPPLVNPIRKPGEWQTYDIVFHQPIHDEKGALVHPGTLTILFNGVLVQDNREIEGPTLYCARTADKVHPDRGPIRLQDHNGNVRFRNIWIREIKSPWTEDVVSGTSVVSTNAVRAQRQATARRMLDGLKDIPDAYARLVSALEMLSYSSEEPFLSAATALADAEAEAFPKYAKEVRAKHVSELKWYFEKMHRGGCLPLGWRLLREVYRDPSDPAPEKVTEKIELFNGKDLTNWYTWIRTYGKNNDPKGVFTVTNGVIRVYGPEGYNGCITTERSFRDYRLVVEFRYTGELFGKKLATNAAPDSGILFHSTGRDGAFYDTWMSSWEYNLIVGANGDFWSVIDGRPGKEFRPDMQLTARGVRKFIGGEKYPSLVYDPNGAETRTLRLGCDHVFNSHVVPTYRNRAGDPVQDCEKPVGEWNVAELICDGDKATCILNGVVVNAAENIYPDYGRIQLQNESCGCEFRRITLYPLGK